MSVMIAAWSDWIELKLYWKPLFKKSNFGIEQILISALPAIVF